MFHQKIVQQTCIQLYFYKCMSYLSINKMISFSKFITSVLIFISSLKHRAEAIYQSMKATFGVQICHLLQINSRSLNTMDNLRSGISVQPDPWSQFLSRRNSVTVSSFSMLLLKHQFHLLVLSLINNYQVHAVLQIILGLAASIFWIYNIINYNVIILIPAFFQKIYSSLRLKSHRPTSHLFKIQTFFLYK